MSQSWMNFLHRESRRREFRNRKSGHMKCRILRCAIKAVVPHDCSASCKFDEGASDLNADLNSATYSCNSMLLPLLIRILPIQVCSADGAVCFHMFLAHFNTCLDVPSTLLPLPSPGIPALCLAALYFFRRYINWKNLAIVRSSPNALPSVRFPV
jgi:hypothetical protein